MTDGTVSLQIKGEQLLLHPERAVVWSRLKTVIVADTHFGKSSYFARHGTRCRREPTRLIAPG